MKVIMIFLLMTSASVYADNFYPFLKWTTPAGDGFNGTGRESCIDSNPDGSCNQYTPLDSSEIKEYRIYQEYGFGTGDYRHVSTYPMHQSLEDAHYLRVFTVSEPTCFKVTAVDTDDRESRMSEKLCFSRVNPPAVQCTVNQQ